MSSRTATRAAATRGEPALRPKLRFPAFRGTEAWSRAFGDELFDQINNKDHNSDLPVLAITQEHGAIPRDMIDYHVSVAEKSIESYKIVEVGDFIISLRSFQGGIEYSRFKGICSPAYVILRLKPSHVADYFRQFLKTDRFIGQLTKNLEGLRDGKMVSYKQFSDLHLPTPTLEEQQKIANCLSSLDELIAAQARKVDGLNSHKMGLMQQLFPVEPKSHPPLRFPSCRSQGQWRPMSIQELLDRSFIIGHLDGNHGALYPRAEEFADTGVPYISATNFRNGGVDFERCKFLPVDRAKQFKKGVALSGDILFAHNATVGPVAKLFTKNDFVILSTSLTYFRCNSALLSSDFLKCALVSPGFVDQCVGVMSQSTRDQVPITTQRTFTLPIPTLQEQRRVADCLTSLDELITAATQELDALKTHKKGLMQQLFPSAAETMG